MASPGKGHVIGVRVYVRLNPVFDLTAYMSFSLSISLVGYAGSRIMLTHVEAVGSAVASRLDFCKHNCGFSDANPVQATIRAGPEVEHADMRT